MYVKKFAGVVLALCIGCNLTACAADTEELYEIQLSGADYNTITPRTEEETERSGVIDAGTSRIVAEEQEERRESAARLSLKEEKRKNPTAISQTQYAYSCLMESEQRVYSEILDCILTHQEEISLSVTDLKTVDLAYKAVNADHGGLFWVNGYSVVEHSLAGVVTDLEFLPQYTMDAAEKDKLQAQVDSAVEDFLSGISLSASDYEKTKYVYEQLITKVDYDENAKENQNILSVFLYGSTVCQGYADATQYLLAQLGIESFVVTGTTRNENHAWTCARLDGEYYYIDTTFGNSMYSGDSRGFEGKFVNYEYLNITGEELSRNHVTDMPFDMPSCTARTDNYYVKENLYYTTFDPSAVGNLLRASWEGDRAMVSVKFADTELYDQAYAYFIRGKHIADYCDGLESYSYVDDTAKAVLTIGF